MLLQEKPAPACTHQTTRQCSQQWQATQQSRDVISSASKCVLAVPLWPAVCEYTVLLALHLPLYLTSPISCFCVHLFWALILHPAEQTISASPSFTSSSSSASPPLSWPSAVATAAPAARLWWRGTRRLWPRPWTSSPLQWTGTRSCVRAGAKVGELRGVAVQQFAGGEEKAVAVRQFAGGVGGVGGVGMMCA